MPCFFCESSVDTACEEAASCSGGLLVGCADSMSRAFLMILSPTGALRVFSNLQIFNTAGSSLEPEATLLAFTLQYVMASHTATDHCLQAARS